MAMAVTLPMVANTTNTASSPLLPSAPDAQKAAQAVKAGDVQILRINPTLHDKWSCSNFANSGKPNQSRCRSNARLKPGGAKSKTRRNDDLKGKRPICDSWRRRMMVVGASLYAELPIRISSGSPFPSKSGSNRLALEVCIA